MTAVKNFRVDSFVADLAIKAPCKTVSLTNLTLSGEQTVGVVPVIVGDRVLVTAQTDLIETSATELRSSARERLERRRRWQDGIREILDSSKTRSQKTGELRRFFADFDAHEDAEMEAIERANGDVIDRLTVQIARLMTQDQTDHFVERTNDYIRMFTELARE